MTSPIHWQAATLVRRYGFHLVEIPQGSKAPKRPNWQTETIATPERAEAHWLEHPTDNIGVVLGPSRMCSIDVDDAENTRLIFSEFGIDIDEYAKLYTSCRGNPARFKVFFRVPDGMAFERHVISWPRKDDPTKRAVVFEIRGGSGQDVLPPSMHPDGYPYTWICKPNGAMAEIPAELAVILRQWDVFKKNAVALCPWAQPERTRAILPRTDAPKGGVIEAWNAAHDLTATLLAHGYTAQGRRFLSPHSTTQLAGVAILQDGQRCWIHHASDPLCSEESGQPVGAFDLFCQYEHGGDVRRAVKAAAEALGLPDLRGREVTAAEPQADAEKPLVADYTPRSHPDIIEDHPVPTDIFECPALPPLTRDVLPPALADFIFDQSEIIGSDPCILAISVLVSCAAVTHDSIKIQPKENEHGWRESARLWGTFVGDPSVKKTPPLNRAVAHLRKLDFEYAEAGAEAMQRYKIARKVYEAAEKRYIDDQSKNKPVGPLMDPPDKPKQRRLIVQDATIEALADILADNSGGVMVLFDELSGFFGSMDAYRAVSGKDRSFWLESYNGGPRRIDRVSRETTPVPNLSTCILGGIQPHAMREQARKMVDDGLLQRFMIVVAQGGESLGSDRRADSGATQAYRSILDALATQSGDPDNPVTFDDDARAVLIHVERQLQVFAKLETLPVRMRYQLGKWSGLFCRLCLTYHAIECAYLGIPVAGRVAGDLAERVRQFMFKFLFWHLQHFYEVVIGDTGNRAELAQRVADWILAKRIDRFPESALNQALKAWRSLRWEDRRNILDTLEVCGWIEKVRRTEVGGRTVWEVNPTVHEIFADRAEAERERREQMRKVFMNE